MKSLNAMDFNLSRTLECGQEFSWEKYGEHYYGFIGCDLVKIKQEGNQLFYFGNAGREDIERYFSLDMDIKAITGSFNKDKYIGEAIDSEWGLRIIRQDPFQCAFSFILSAFNNIKRIRKIVGIFSKLYGKRFERDGKTFFGFPEYESVRGLTRTRLKECGMGFRDKYVCGFVKGLNDISLSDLKKANYKDLKAGLMDFKGIGDKVADCICLFAYQKYEAFPVDTWITRMMEKFYFSGRKTDNRTIREFAGNYFGTYCGYAQEYLYSYWRNKI